MKKNISLISIFLLVSVSFCFTLISCYQAPITGRTQFILLSESQEIQMGLVAFQDVLKKEKLSTNPKYNSCTVAWVSR